MYAKIFSQIFDSSIAENYEVRHVFEDLLKMADTDGVVDMTVEAVARKANMPFEKVHLAIEELLKPDLESRSKDYDGRRIIPLEPGRNWGWLIVNYNRYREIPNEEARRQYFRDAKRRQREAEAKDKAKRKRDAKKLAESQAPVGESPLERAFDKECSANGDNEKTDALAATRTESFEPDNMP